MLGIHTRNSGNGFLKQTCRINLFFGSASHFANIGSWKAGSPTSNSLLLKAQSYALVCSSHIAQLRAQSLYCHKSWRPQLRDQTLCFSAYDRFFLLLQRRDGHGATMIYCRDGGVQASGREWRLGIFTRNRGNGFLKQTCGTNLFSAVRHILRTSAAERPAAPLPTHGA